MLTADGSHFSVDMIIWTLMIPESSVSWPKPYLNVFISFPSNLYKNLLYCVSDMQIIIKDNYPE